MALLGVVVIFAVILLLCRHYMIRMPKKSFKGPLPPLNPKEKAIRRRVEDDLNILAYDIGERNVQRCYTALVQGADFIEQRLGHMGYEIHRQRFWSQGKEVWNLWAEIPGHQKKDEILIIGSHYDTVPHSPGANDNGSAITANLELARALYKQPLKRTVRFVFFVNEEYPHFMTEEMGSLVYARSLKQKKEKISGMVCLETIGCYYDMPGTQRYPPPLHRIYPNTGNFISFVGNLKSRSFVHRSITSFRQHASFPSEGITATELIRDIRRSDHYPFWRQGWPAFMVTDTANFRYPHYHKPTDLPNNINMDCLCRVISGLIQMVKDLANYI